MVRDQVSTEGIANLSPVALKVHLGQGQNDVQGRCRVATGNSFYAKAQVDYGEFNRVNCQGYPCSVFFTVATSDINSM